MGFLNDIVLHETYPVCFSNCFVLVRMLIIRLLIPPVYGIFALQSYTKKRGCEIINNI